MIPDTGDTRSEREAGTGPEANELTRVVCKRTQVSRAESGSWSPAVGPEG